MIDARILAQFSVSLVSLSAVVGGRNARELAFLNLSGILLVFIIPPLSGGGDWRPVRLVCRCVHLAILWSIPWHHPPTLLRCWEGRSSCLDAHSGAGSNGRLQTAFGRSPLSIVPCRHKARVRSERVRLIWQSLILSLSLGLPKSAGSYSLRFSKG